VFKHIGKVIDILAKSLPIDKRANTRFRIPHEALLPLTVATTPTCGAATTSAHSLASSKAIHVDDL
jgi:hypothetical protein